MAIEKIYTVTEAGKALGRSRQTIHAYIRAGLLPAFKMGTGQTSKFYIKESDLEKFLDNGIPAGYYQELYPRPHKPVNPDKPRKIQKKPQDKNGEKE